MKTKLTFDFNNIDEAKNFLDKIGGGHSVEVSSSTTTAPTERVGLAKVLEPTLRDPLAIGKDLSKYNKTELKKVCAERGIPYNSTAKNDDLLVLIEAPAGVAAPVPNVQVAEVPVPPVIVEPVAVPAAPVTVLTEAAPQEVSSPITQESLLNDFTATFEAAQTNGVSVEMLGTTVNSQLGVLGYAAGTRLSQLSGAHLQKLVGMFKAHVVTLTNQVVQQPINNNFV